MIKVNINLIREVLKKNKAATLTADASCSSIWMLSTSI